MNAAARFATRRTGARPNGGGLCHAILHGYRSQGQGFRRPENGSGQGAHSADRPGVAYESAEFRTDMFTPLTGAATVLQYDTLQTHSPIRVAQSHFVSAHTVC